MKKRVIIGVDPHKMSVDDRGRRRPTSGCWGRGRFGTDKAGYAAMRALRQSASRPRTGSGRSREPTAPAVRWPSGSSPPASEVVDVPAKLAARVRLFDTGHNRKTDALDAHSIAVVAVRTRGCGWWSRTVSSRRCGCSPTAATSCPSQRVQTVNRLQRLLANCCLASANGPVRRPGQGDARHRAAPRHRREDPRRMAAEEIADLVALDAKLKKIKAELKAAVTDRGSQPDGPVRGRPGRRRPDPGRRR